VPRSFFVVLANGGAAHTLGLVSLKIYTLSNCDRCRAATRWLRAQGLRFDEVPIRETPPARAELVRMHAATGSLRALFNTSGRDYRELKLGSQLDEMTEDAAFALLAANGNLVKRPFLVGPHVALVGFDEGAWKSALIR
jgi:arsenate reductase